MDEWLEESVSFTRQLAFNFREISLEGWQAEQGLEGVDALLVLLLHEEQTGLKKEPPLIEHVIINLYVIGSCEDVIGLIEILLLYLDFHHHFD
jgi:hypothetical protein